MPWKKGESGNPGGRKHTEALRQVARAREMAQKNSPKAILTLIKMLNDPDKAVSAACAILDRAMGRPRQEIVAEVREILGGIDAPVLPAEDVQQWLERRAKERAAAQKLN